MDIIKQMIDICVPIAGRYNIERGKSCIDCSRDNICSLHFFLVDNPWDAGKRQQLERTCLTRFHATIIPCHLLPLSDPLFRSIFYTFLSSLRIIFSVAHLSVRIRFLDLCRLHSNEFSLVFSKPICDSRLWNCNTITDFRSECETESHARFDVSLRHYLVKWTLIITDCEERKRIAASFSFANVWDEKSTVETRHQSSSSLSDCNKLRNNQSWTVWDRQINHGCY